MVWLPNSSLIIDMMRKTHRVKNSHCNPVTIKSCELNFRQYAPKPDLRSDSSLILAIPSPGLTVVRKHDLRSDSSLIPAIPSPGLIVVRSIHLDVNLPTLISEVIHP